MTGNRFSRVPNAHARNGRWPCQATREPTHPYQLVRESSIESDFRAALTGGCRWMPVSGRISVDQPHGVLPGLAANRRWRYASQLECPKMSGIQPIEPGLYRCVHHRSPQASTREWV